MDNKILIVTGEASGDLHGALLVTEIKKIKPDLKIFALGSKKMEEAGVKIIFESTQLAVFGFTEIFGKLNLIKKASDEIKKFILKEKPALTVLIDYPGFNIRIAKFLQNQKIPVVYYIGPQIWAWNSNRIKILAKLIKKMIVVFPFEEKIYRDAGMDVEFVGHPLLDLVKPKIKREEIKKKFGLKEDVPVIGILPGSREEEVNRLLPAMVRVCRDIKVKIQDAQFVVCWAGNLDIKLIEEKLKGINFPVSIISGWNYELISVCDLVLVASGTATLETAILDTPMIILGKIHWFSYLLAKILVTIPHVGLPNVLAGKMIVPEILQGKVKSKIILPLALNLLQDKEKAEKMRSDLRAIREKLGMTGAARRAAEAILKELNG